METIPTLRGMLISLCDDYSIPVDFVNKRPRSIGGGLANWTTPSPNGDTVDKVVFKFRANELIIEQ
ncbi:hypothetical protein J437_LFUL015366 [Ladona fulva]|uniref:Uncharacterized protein n=1 Tax=Ladona fulva TaxID=123851 RepID=A0A8K0P3J6_LADFU|nr:hypothetical protein J437_LFUL015366 [Ladona fulva]